MSTSGVLIQYQQYIFIVANISEGSFIIFILRKNEKDDFSFPRLFVQAKNKEYV